MVWHGKTGWNDGWLVMVNDGSWWLDDGWWALMVVNDLQSHHRWSGCSIKRIGLWVIILWPWWRYQNNQLLLGCSPAFWLVGIYPKTFCWDVHLPVVFDFLLLGILTQSYWPKSFGTFEKRNLSVCPWSPARFRNRMLQEIIPLHRGSPVAVSGPGITSCESWGIKTTYSHGHGWTWWNDGGQRNHCICLFFNNGSIVRKTFFDRN